jgi:hypothetical protein
MGSGSILYKLAVFTIRSSSITTIIETWRVTLVQHVARVVAAPCINNFGHNIKIKHLDNFIEGQYQNQKN